MYARARTPRHVRRRSGAGPPKAVDPERPGGRPRSRGLLTSGSLFSGPCLFILFIGFLALPTLFAVPDGVSFFGEGFGAFGVVGAPIEDGPRSGADVASRY